MIYLTFYGLRRCATFNRNMPQFLCLSKDCSTCVVWSIVQVHNSKNTFLSYLHESHSMPKVHNFVSFIVQLNHENKSEKRSVNQQPNKN